MKIKLLTQTFAILIGIWFSLPAGFNAAAAPEPNIGVNGYFSVDKAQRGRITQAAIVIDIPSGFHVNSNRPLEKYLIATQLKIEAPGGIRVGPVSYPRASLRTFKFSKNQLSVYEGRAILRFNVTVPANYQSNEAVLKARVRFQSCNAEVCFPPKNQDIDMGIGVVGANDRAQRTNAWVFGRR
jgi:DsbC/DsbD-like thiol-disulfide interchange protein